MIFYLDCFKEDVLPEGIAWQYYDSNRLSFTRITEPGKMNIERPFKNRSLITVEAPFSSGDLADQKDSKVICAEIINQIVSIGLLKKHEINDITMVKERFVYPVQYSGYQKELARVESII